MQLWNDYEGKTIAEVYSLGALLRPEGRSALFSLQKGVEAPAIIRLTEALNDEGAMLHCWRRVTEVKQENLVKIKRFGRTNFEGTPLTYAVMELTDANLADLLKERPLTYPEAMQVATSVAAALTALHAKGLVHEHVDAANVLAAGETVKLRTDCVSECVVEEGRTTAAECMELIQRDVQDLCTLLLRSLTLEKKLSPTTKLPAPFDKVIPNGLNGRWGLPEISSALTPRTIKPLVPEEVLKQSESAPRPQPAALRSEPVATPRQEGVRTDADLRYGKRWKGDNAAPAQQNIRLWAACAGVFLLVLALSFYFFHGKSAASPEASTPQTTASPAALQTATPQAANQMPATPTAAPTLPNSGSAIATSMQAGWYVIAYTYNHRDQATKRVAEIVQRHPALNPQVVAPNGNTFLVAIGGAMNRDQAESVRNRARRSGMPRDTYVRNYKGN